MPRLSKEKKQALADRFISPEAYNKAIGPLQKIMDESPDFDTFVDKVVEADYPNDFYDGLENQIKYYYLVCEAQLDPTLLGLEPGEFPGVQVLVRWDISKERGKIIDIKLFLADRPDWTDEDEMHEICTLSPGSFKVKKWLLQY